jgi:D-arabinose 1-dehydrogenase-like Zn-dependent alcohol dehydrogenase
MQLKETDKPSKLLLKLDIEEVVGSTMWNKILFCGVCHSDIHTPQKENELRRHNVSCCTKDMKCRVRSL